MLLPVSAASVSSFSCARGDMRGTRLNQFATNRGADFGLAGRRIGCVSSQITICANS